MSSNNNPPQPEPPISPEQLLIKLILTNTEILSKVTVIMQQQMIYTNALLFPNNDRPISTSPSPQSPSSNPVTADEGNNNRNSNKNNN